MGCVGSAARTQLASSGGSRSLPSLVRSGGDAEPSCSSASGSLHSNTACPLDCPQPDCRHTQPSGSSEHRYLVSFEDAGNVKSGVLELCDDTLTLRRRRHEVLSWPLTYLRRYGYNDNQFCIEAGRRCTKGPATYTFQCDRAQELFRSVQRRIEDTAMIAANCAFDSNLSTVTLPNVNSDDMPSVGRGEPCYLTPDNVILRRAQTAPLSRPSCPRDRVRSADLSLQLGNGRTSDSPLDDDDDDVIALLHCVDFGPNPSRLGRIDTTDCEDQTAYINVDLSPAPTQSPANGCYGAVHKVSQHRPIMGYRYANSTSPSATDNQLPRRNRVLPVEYMNVTAGNVCQTQSPGKWALGNRRRATRNVEYATLELPCNGAAQRRTSKGDQSHTSPYATIDTVRTRALLGTKRPAAQQQQRAALGAPVS